MSDSESPTGPRDERTRTRGRRSAPGLRPAAPLADRLNRNALIVAACVLGMAALVAVVFLAPGKGTTSTAAEGSGGRSGPPPQPPSFMDRPAPPPPIAPSGNDGRPAASGDTAPAAVPPPIAGDSARRAERDRYATATDADESIYRSPARGVAARTTPDSDDDYHRALQSPVVVAVSSADRGASPQPPPSAVMDGALWPVGMSPRPGVPSSVGTVDTRPSMRSPLPPRDGAVPLTVASARHLSAGYLLAAGSVVSAVLVTALNSDLPGDVGAQVTRDIYDSPTQSVVLIPKGAKLVGRFSSSVVHGQKRVALTWVRVNLPNGEAINLPSQPATDERGAAGVPADVDNHVFRTFSAAGIAAAIGAGVELSQPRNGGSVLTTPTVGQVLAGSLGQELGTVGLEIVRRELDVPPTLSIPPGALFNLLLTTVLSFARPYGAPAS